MSADRRRFPRIALTVDVDLTTGSNFYAGRTRDISVGGLFIEADVRLEPGTEIALSLDLDGKMFKLKGVVAWHLVSGEGSSCGLGVEFRDLSNLTRKSIQAFMKRREPVAFEEVQLLPESVPPPRKGPPPLPVGAAR